MLNISGRIQQPKNEKNVLYLLTKKMNSFCPARRSAQNADFLLIITGWGEQYFRALSKYFLGKNGSAPLEKIGPYAYDNSI